MVAPRLITPDGKTVELSRRIYQRIQKLLREEKEVASRGHRPGHVDATYGKYAGKTSLTQALLAERKKEIEREETKPARMRK